MSSLLRRDDASLRTRLAVALAAVMLGPVLLGAVAAAVLIPAHARSSAQAESRRDLAGATVALTTRCQVIGDLNTATARQVSGYAGSYPGGLPAEIAQKVVDAAVENRPGVAVAILDTDGRTAAVAGTTAGRAPAGAGGYGASCAQGRAGQRPDLIGLSESQPVLTYLEGRRVTVGTVVSWQPVDDATLTALATGLGSDGRLVALPANGTTTARDVADGARWAQAGPAAGLPFRLVALQPVDGVGPGRGALVVVVLAGLAGLLLIRLVAFRMAAPLSGEMAQLAGELETNRRELDRSRGAAGASFQHFVETLGRTHDLDGLLQTVVGACAQVTEADTAVALLEDEDGLHQRAQHHHEDDDRAQRLVRAAETVHREHRTGERTGADAEQLLLLEQDGLGWVLVVPLRASGPLFGVLALTRTDGAAFSSSALEQVRVLAEHAGTAIANVQQHEEARRLSVTDALTGAGNVRALSTTLSREVERATRFDRPLTVLMLDIDHFKQVNDDLGHAFGDAVLKDFALRLRRCLREVDFVARYGGEEFAIVLPETDVDGGCRAATRVLEAVRAEPFGAEPSGGDGVIRTVTTSIGVAALGAHGRSATELLRAADAALYTAKRAGRDRWVVAGVSSDPAVSVPQAG